MSQQIRFTTREVISGGGDDASRLDVRAWRLLAFLIWHAHLAARAEQPPPVFRREQLELPVALGSPQDLRTALSGARSLLRLVGSERQLMTNNGEVMLLEPEQLDCDLVAVLEACRNGDRSSVVALVEALAHGRRSFEMLGRWLRPRGEIRRKHAAWIDDLVEEVSAYLNDKTPQTPDLDDQTRAYLDFHVGRCSWIDPRRMGRTAATQDVRLPLEDVYVSLILGPRVSSEVAADRELTMGEQSIADPSRDGLLLFDDGEQIHFTELIRTTRWAVILGKPGMGKTTLLQWLALFNARALMAGRPRVLVGGAQLGVKHDQVDLGPARLPILVRVADYAATALEGGVDTIPELIDFLGSHPVADERLPLPPEVAAQIIRRWLDAGRALVLLDGLDEVSDPTLRGEIVTRVERFVQSHTPDPVVSTAFTPWSSEDAGEWWRVHASEPAARGGSQVVVTSREHGYKEAALTGPFRLVYARPLDLLSIRRFCERWSLAVERFHAIHSGASEAEITRSAAANSARLIDAVESNPNIRRLADNPLLLTVLAMLQQEPSELPGTRLEIYERITRVLVARRRLDWRYQEVVDGLGPLALWLQENRAQGHASLPELREHLRTGVERITSRGVEQQVDLFIEAAQQQAGLLVEVGTGRFGFMHATFREYFAAVELSRDPASFSRWLPAHRHAARWIEVAILGVASIADHHPGKVDDLLAAILDEPSPLEPLLYNDLLFVAACLAETVRASPALTSRVVAELLSAGRAASDAGFEDLRSRITHALVLLRDSRGRVVIPDLVESLSESQVAPIATEILADASAETPELLGGLDRACHQPDRSPIAVAARARVATVLHERGEEVAAELLPLATLFGEGSRYEVPFAAICAVLPELGEVLREIGTRVQPALLGLVRWLLAVVESEPHLCDAPNELLERFVGCALELLDSVCGGDFSAVAGLALRLDVPRMRRHLADMLSVSGVDASSAARFLASHPDAILQEEVELEAWLERLDADTASVLLSVHHPSLRHRLVEVAWRWLGLSQPAQVREPACKLLLAEAASSGRLLASSTALDTLDALCKSEDHSWCRLAQTLLATLSVDGDPARSNRTIGCLEAIVVDCRDPRAKAAAVMLAEIPTRVISPTEYELIAQAIASDEELRPRAFGALEIQRSANTVSDELLALSYAHGQERDTSGDSAAADVHMGVAQKIQYEDGARALEAIKTEKPWGGSGMLSATAAELLIEAAPQLDETQASAAINACLGRLRANLPSGLDVERLQAFALQLPGQARQLAARLVAGEMVLQSHLDWLAPFLSELASVDYEAMARAYCMAAYCLPSAGVPNARAEALKLQAMGASCVAVDVPDARWMMAGAQLAADVLTLSTPGEAIGLLAERLASHGETAKGIIFALDTAQILPTGTAEEPIGRTALGLVVRRLLDVAACFCLTPRGMQALVDQCCACLGDAEWTMRRACLLALSAGASASPAQFLKAAHGTPLRDLIIAAGGDRRSYTVRRLAVSVLSEFRMLDGWAMDLVAAACKDYALVGYATIERCRTFDTQDNLDISELVGLLSRRNPRAVEAAAVLIAALARSAPPTPRGHNQHQSALASLADLAASPDPLLDCFATSRRRTLRQTLLEQLADLIWDTQPRPAQDAALGRTATQPLWDETELGRLAPASPATPRPTTRLGDAIRAVAKRTRTGGATSAKSFRLDDLVLSAETCGLGDLGDREQYVLIRAAYETLEMRVGVDLADHFTATQLDEFKRFFDAKDKTGAFHWLQANRPDYKDVVKQEAESLVKEITASRDDLRRLVNEALHDDAPSDE